jgi:hypothetical protein
MNPFHFGLHAKDIESNKTDRSKVLTQASLKRHNRITQRSLAVECRCLKLR